MATQQDNRHHQRREGGRGAEHADQQALRQSVDDERRRQPCQNVSRGQHQRRAQQRLHRAEAVGQAPHQDSAGTEAQHGERVGH
jgi:hypothetical protein